MQQHADIQLPLRTSRACHWQNLSGEILDALVDAIHHPRVLDGSLRPCLHVEITANLLTPDPHDDDMRILSRQLVSSHIDHLFQCRPTMTAHRIHICLTVYDQSMSQIDEPLRISQRRYPQPNRNTTMSIINPNQPQRLHSQPNRSNPMNNNPKLSNIPDHAPRKLKKKSWFGGFIDWLFGPAEEIEKHRDDPIVDPLNTGGEMEPTDSWLEAFNQALTQATADFIRKQVEPLHREDPSCGFSIRAVKVGMTEATRPCLEALEKLPPDLCGRIAKIRMQQAHGALQIRLDNFFGISIDADNALLDGPVVQTLVSYGGKRVQLKFRFDGDYVNLPSAATSSLPVETTDDVYDWPCVTESTKEETPLARFSEPPSAKQETPLAQPAVLRTQQVIAKLRVKPYGGKETVVEIGENELPYTIGREPQGHGFVIETDNEGSTTAVSRKHLILQSFDTLTGHFFMYNQSRNGTYDKGRPMPERFIHTCAKDHWLSLGGFDGVGTVQISLELP
ncbi:MAG: hypothetical protein ACXW1Z_12085 [Methylobacter sp.]